jgi:hypothetical protein
VFECEVRNFMGTEIPFVRTQTNARAFAYIFTQNERDRNVPWAAAVRIKLKRRAARQMYASFSGLENGIPQAGPKGLPKGTHRSLISLCSRTSSNYSLCSFCFFLATAEDIALERNARVEMNQKNDSVCKQSRWKYLLFPLATST